MPSLDFLSASELVRQIVAKKVSATELLDHCAARIAAHNPALNAIVTQNMDTARNLAWEADASLAKGEMLGPLHGLPITIKDAFEVKGLTSTGGHPALKDHVPDRDADAVAQLRSNGAIIMGKTNVPFLSGDFQTYNDVYGTTNNPWNLKYTPGGSSGGAAAVVAAGLSAFEIGSDIGGSIRGPAHFCGLFGLKPSFGIVPLRGHVPPMPGFLAPSDIAVAGPIARSAEDLYLVLDCIAEAADDEQAWTLDLPPARHTSARGLRVALWLDDDFARTDDEIKSLITTAAKALEAEGAIIDSTARPDFSFAEAYASFALVMFSIIAADFPEKLRERMIAQVKNYAPDDISHDALQARGAALSYGQSLRIHQKRANIRAAWAQFFKDFDVVLCPAAPIPAFPHDHRPIGKRKLTINGQERHYFDFMHWASLAGGAYLPAAIAPIGRTKAGLPVGVQIIGPRLEDRTPIAVAAMLEEITGGFTPPPDFG